MNAMRLAVEPLEQRRLLTLGATWIGAFEICQTETATIEYGNATQNLLAVGLGERGCGSRLDYESLVRTDGTREGTMVVGEGLGEQLVMGSLEPWRDAWLFEVLTFGRTTYQLYATDMTSSTRLSDALAGYVVQPDQVVYTEDYGRELWSYDGSSQNRIAEFGDREVFAMGVRDGQILFRFFGESLLWTTDGTSEGTHPVELGQTPVELPPIDRRPTVQASEPFRGGTALLKLRDGATTLYSRTNQLGLDEYWLSDETQSQSQWIGLAPPAPPGSAGCIVPDEYIETEDHIFFSRQCGGGIRRFDTYALSNGTKLLAHF